MSSLKSKIATGGATALVVILIIAALYGVSWIATCGIIKLITMCFGLTFKWSIATGIWLIICILRSIFNVTVKNNLAKCILYIVRMIKYKHYILIK